MKVTKKYIEKLIKEELENVLNETTRYRAEFSPDGVSVYVGSQHIMTVTKGQAEYYNPIAGAAVGNKKAKMELAKQLSQKVGREISPNDIETAMVDNKALPDA